MIWANVLAFSIATNISCNFPSSWSIISSVFNGGSFFPERIPHFFSRFPPPPEVFYAPEGMYAVGEGEYILGILDIREGMDESLTFIYLLRGAELCPNRTGVKIEKIPCPSSGRRSWQEAGISPQDAKRIQNAANSKRIRITVVGSRARGEAEALSDWDYILSGSSRQRSRARNSLPHGEAGGEIRGLRESGADFWQDSNPNARSYSPVERERPYVIFEPQQFYRE